MKFDLDKFRLSIIPKVYLSYFLDTPFFAIGTLILIKALILQDAILNSLLIFACILTIEFYFSNLGAEIKSFLNIKNGLLYISKLKSKATLSSLSYQQIEYIFGEELLSYFENLKKLKIQIVRKLGLEPNYSKIKDEFKVLTVKRLSVIPTAFASAAGGVSIIIIPEIEEKISSFQKFLLLHEFGHISHSQNMYDKKRAIERVLSALIACMLIMVGFESTWKYLAVIFLIFRILSVTSSSYSSLNESQADLFAFKNLNDTEFESVYKTLKRSWETKLINIKDKNGKRMIPISEEVIVERRLNNLESFNGKPEYRKIDHFGLQEGIFSHYGISILATIFFFLGEKIVIDFRILLFSILICSIILNALKLRFK